MESVPRYKRIPFYWVSGHKGIGGNEIKDEITKSGVQLSSGNVTDFDKPMHCLYDNLDRSGWEKKLENSMCRSEIQEIPTVAR